MIPSHNPTVSETVLTNDGFFPDIAVPDFYTYTGLGTEWTAARVEGVLQTALISINNALAPWRATLPKEYASLGQVPGGTYNGVSEKIHLYREAVFCRARALLLETTRDYDSTNRGHDKADALEGTAEVWHRRTAEALQNLTRRRRTHVELI